MVTHPYVNPGNAFLTCGYVIFYSWNIWSFQTCWFFLIKLRKWFLYAFCSQHTKRPCGISNNQNSQINSKWKWNKSNQWVKSKVQTTKLPNEISHSFHSHTWLTNLWLNTTLTLQLLSQHFTAWWDRFNNNQSFWRQSTFKCFLSNFHAHLHSNNCIRSSSGLSILLKDTDWNHQPND